jgi:hypothetical protein
MTEREFTAALTWLWVGALVFFVGFAAGYLHAPRPAPHHHHHHHHYAAAARF